MILNEKHFSIGIIAVVVSIMAYLLIFAGIEKDSVIGMLGGIGFNVTLLLSLGFGLQYFQMGTRFDIQKEIYDEQNIAGAIYQAGIWIALAIVIAKGLI
jgi:hypothetical protein